MSYNLAYSLGMNTLGEKIKALRLHRDMSLSDLADRIGIDRANLWKKEQGKVKFKNREIKAVAEVFGLTVEQLDASSLPASTVVENVGIPVVNRGPAGALVNYEEYGVQPGQGYEYIDRDPETKSADLFALIVVGHSMCPVLAQGDTVILKPVEATDLDEAITPGKVVLVRLGPEESGHEGCMLCQWWDVKDQPDMVRLHKANPAFPGVVVPRSQIVRLFVAIQKRSKL